MPHDTPLITTIVAALVLAFIFGAIANRLKMPPIVGYLIAGVCVGPYSPGFVADQALAQQLAEIGVILLMFGVGLHFSLRDLLSVKAIAIPGALIRMAFATAMGIGFGILMGWSLLGGLVFGLGLAVSSTVVTLKVLQDRHLMDSDRGRIAMGWLVVEDLAMVLALVLIPAFAGATAAGLTEGSVHAPPPDAFVALTEQLLHTKLELWAIIGLTLIKLLAFVGFMVIVGRRVIPFILHATAHTGSRELFRLAVLAVALGVAAGAAYFFGVSLALGAFFAGMILSESELSQRAAQETLPLRDAFGVLFFVSVGMLFDPTIIVREPLPVLATLVIIIFGKSIVGFLLMLLFRRPVGSALTVSASLAQIGEFSFILAALGVSLGIMPEEGRSLILAGAIISIVLNPLVFWASERVRPRLEARVVRRTEPELGPVVPDREDQVPAAPVAEPVEVLEEVAQPTGLSNHVVLIGYGRVGSVVAEELGQEGAPFVLIEDAEGRVLKAREAGIEVIVGNAATPEALRLANVMGARCVVIAIPNAFEAGQATEQCRKLNSAVKIIARAHSDEEIDYLTRLGADEVVMGEREIGLGMIDWLKGHERNATHRDAAPTAPKLSGGENLLQQARQAQPAPGRNVAPSEARLEPIVPMPPLSASEEAPMLEETTEAVPAAQPSVLPMVVTSAALATVVASAAAEDEALPAVDMPEVLQLSAQPAEAVSSSPPEVIALASDDAGGGDGAAADVPASATVDAEAADPVEPAPARAPSNFRVVEPSEIIILPPEPTGSAMPQDAEMPARPAFRSEFWQEHEDVPAHAASDGSEPQLFAAGTGPAPAAMRNVQDSLLEQEPLDDSGWLAALERDLFGDSDSADPAKPSEVPPPEPQPLETPHPSEDPVPPPQPIETPRPNEDPVPPAQPIETPIPEEIPGTAPQPVSPPTVPVAPPTRADRDAADTDVEP